MEHPADVQEHHILAPEMGRVTEIHFVTVTVRALETRKD